MEKKENKLKAFCYWSNILLLVLLIVIVITALYARFLVPEEYLMYEQQSFAQYNYFNNTVESYNSTFPPWKECNYAWFPAVCYWHNVPSSKDKTYLHVVNPALAWVYDHEGVITIILLISVLSVNGVLLWLKHKKPTDLK